MKKRLSTGKSIVNALIELNKARVNREVYIGKEVNHLLTKLLEAMEINE